METFWLDFELNRVYFVYTPSVKDISFMSRKRIAFSVDADVYSATRSLANEYDINLSEIVNNALLSLLLPLREVDKVIKQNPERLSPELARAYVNQKLVQVNGVTQALLDELVPAPQKTKVKA